MTRDRLDWILSGLDRKKLNRFERELINHIEKKLEQPENLTGFEENRDDRPYLKVVN